MKELDLTIFPHSDKAKWLQKATEQLNGADPYQSLRWDSFGITGLYPYYDAADVTQLTYLSDFFSNMKPYRWKLYEEIPINDEREANKAALEALSGGCDGIIFLMKEDFDRDVLLQNIDTKICDIWMVSTHEATSNCLTANHQRGPVAQLAEILESLSTHKLLIRNSFGDFFLEIATLRALRFLLNQNEKRDVHIHSKVDKHESEEHQWFFNTTAGLASILGGSNSISLFTATGNPRTSRNVGNLIRDESGIEDFQDQCGGSYFVEALTHKIIEEVQKKSES